MISKIAIQKLCLVTIFISNCFSADPISETVTHLPENLVLSDYETNKKKYLNLTIDDLLQNAYNSDPCSRSVLIKKINEEFFKDKSIKQIETSRLFNLKEIDTWSDDDITAYLTINLSQENSIDINVFNLVSSQAQLNQPAHQYNMGLICIHAVSAHQNYPKALEWFHKSAAQENRLAQFYIGKIYAQGLSVQVDQQEATNWFRKAGKNGHATAQNNMGYRYLNGVGIQQNSKRAFKWLRRSSKQGHPTAYTQLGQLYLNGLGFERNYDLAIKYFKKAVPHKIVTAVYFLGYMFEQGLAVEKNYEEALSWYKKAAKRKHVNALYRLGCMYKNGLGVQQNLKEAIIFFIKAAKRGNIDAKKKLNKLFKKSSVYTQFDKLPSSLQTEIDLLNDSVSQLLEEFNYLHDAALATHLPSNIWQGLVFLVREENKITLTLQNFQLLLQSLTSPIFMFRCIQQRPDISTDILTEYSLPPQQDMFYCLDEYPIHILFDNKLSRYINRHILKLEELVTSINLLRKMLNTEDLTTCLNLLMLRDNKNINFYEWILRELSAAPTLPHKKDFLKTLTAKLEDQITLERNIFAFAEELPPRLIALIKDTEGYRNYLMLKFLPD